MSIGSELLDLRRASFRDALRRGDPLAVARAAARLQAHADQLAGPEFVAAREARIAVGRAIREARVRRATLARPMLVPAAIPLQRRRRVRYAAAAAVLIAAVVFGGWLAQPRASDDTSGGGPPAAAAPDAAVPISVQSRGRVVLAVAAAPVVEVPQATTAPEPVTVIAPAADATSGPTAVPGASGGAPGGTNPGGSGAPGSGTGGSGGAAPSAAPTAMPTPRPTPLPPLARGFARLTGVVIDTSTGRGLAGACVSLGPCTAGAPRTDGYGRWTLDLPVGSGRLDWGLEFVKPGYTLGTQSVRSRTGYIFLPPMWIAPIR